MWKDKIVEEVRKTREKILKEFNYDMVKYSEFIIESQKKSKRKIISLEEMKRLRMT